MAAALNDAALRAEARVLLDQGLSSREVAALLNERHGTGIHKSTVCRWAQREEEQQGALKDTTNNGVRLLEGPVGTLEELLDAARVDLTEWVVTRFVTGFHTVTLKRKTASGEHELVQAKNPKATAYLERRPAFFAATVKPVEPLQVELRPRRPEGLALILPDSQHGFRRGPDGGLTPLHDEQACEIALQTAKLLQPDEIILLGDMLDLAPWSKYEQSPDLKYTTQPALVALAAWLAGLRTACPSTKITYLEGNHEARIAKKINEMHDEAATLRSPGSDLPLFSIPSLLSLEDIGVEYVGPYGSDYWLWGVRFHHGVVVRSKGGQTVSAMLGNATHSQVVGHIHRREVASRAIITRDGIREVDAASPGCLCWTDGRVPHKAGATTDWQQGMGILYREGDEAEALHLVPIKTVGEQRVAYVHGQRVVA